MSDLGRDEGGLIGESPGNEGIAGLMRYQSVYLIYALLVYSSWD